MAQTMSFVAFFKGHGHACERSASSNSTSEPIDFTVGLVPDFWRGGLEMDFSVSLVVELVRPQDSIRFNVQAFFCDTPRIVDVIIRVFVGNRIHFDKLGAHDPDGVLFFLALGPGHNDASAIAKCIADNRQTNSGVARSAFNDETAGL